MSEETLQYPVHIAEEIGLHPNEINAFKGRGCRFLGKKTCVRWVREYLRDVTAPKAEAASLLPVPCARRQRSVVSKRGG